MEPIENPRARALRIRFGVCLVVASWLPIAQVTIWLTAPSSSQADRIRAVIWGIQVVVGLIGVAVAGAQTIQVAKSVGWRRSPGAVWRLIRSPNAPVDHGALIIHDHAGVHCGVHEATSRITPRPLCRPAPKRIWKGTLM